FYVPQGDAETRKNALTNYFRTPVPIDIGINMSILTRYQSDMDQILSNFIPFNNPYIILSWQIPSAYNLSVTQEIRSEVLWSGSVSLQYPVEQDPTAKSLIVADTNFTIKGWIFPQETDPVKNIFYINAYLTAVSSKALLEYDNYYALKSETYTLNSPQSAYYNTDVISLSANPQFLGPVSIQVD
ncbi:hypothetical protein EBR43_07935, partial [bacterium]|nr:hypothetical protein [bacterium]